MLLTGIPRSSGSTGCLKGSDSGSCLYRDSRVGIKAWRNSSGLKTEKLKQKSKAIMKNPRGKSQEKTTDKGPLLPRVKRSFMSTFQQLKHQSHFTLLVDHSQFRPDCVTILEYIHTYRKNTMGSNSLFLRDWEGDAEVVLFAPPSSSSLGSVLISGFFSSTSIGSHFSSGSSFFTSVEAESSSVYKQICK